MAWIKDAKTAKDGCEIVINDFDNVHAPEGDYKFDEKEHTLAAPDGEMLYNIANIYEAREAVVMRHTA